MSYQPNRETESPLITAWSSIDVAIPDSGPNNNPTYDFNLDTLGQGARCVLSNDVLTAPDNLKAFWIGDIRVQTDTTDKTDQNYFQLAFADSDGELSAPLQIQRRSMNGDLCYSVYNSARLTIYRIFRCDGTALALYVRVLGILTGV